MPGPRNYDDLTPDEREAYDEYAAKMQYDRGLTRPCAEEEALEHVRQKRAGGVIPDAEFKGLRALLSFRNEADYVRLFDAYLSLVEDALRKDSINGFAPTEQGQAEAAKFYLNGLFRHTPGAGWLAYDFFAGCFRSDVAEKLLRMCLQRLARERYDLRGVEDNPKEHARYAEKAVTYYGIRQAEGLMEDGLVALDSDFDQNTSFLNCRGETYDLRTGVHAPSLPEYFHTRTAGYRPQEGGCPAFRRFLGEITLDDSELGAWIMRWFGYCLTGDTRAAYFVNFHGAGRNGKGTLLHVMRQIMGTYAREIDSEVVVDNGRRGNVKNALANLVGLRSGFAADVPPGALNLSVIKTITGGDEIVAERKYHDSFPFRPIVKLTFSSNPRLRLPETGQAVKSRLRYVPFNYSAAGREDTGLEDKILGEAPQILAWLIKEAGEYLKNPGPRGFPPCKAIDEATEEYIKDEDTLGQFLEERTAAAPEERVKASALYAEYEGWSTGRGEKRAMSIQAFGRKMSGRGLEKKRDMKGLWFTGIKIRGDYG